VLLALTGCTTRTLTITSEPSGAEILIDNRWVGTTPHTKAFRYGGVHEILLFKRLFDTTVVLYDSERMMFDVVPFDFFTDLGPWQAQDHQSVHVTLRPSSLDAAWKRDAESMRDGLEARADVLRRRAREFQLGATPVAPLLPPPKRDPTPKRPPRTPDDKDRHLPSGGRRP
jgi:hypothetical protein